jgi:hypothetical protein
MPIAMQPKRGRQYGTSKGLLRRVSVNISTLVSNFKEANNKLTIIYGSEKLLKNLEKHWRIHRKH